MGNLAVRDVRSFVPTEDLDVSRAFYQALGWTTLWRDGDLALVELGGHRLMLQARYVREWAENTMITIEVESAADWFTHVTRVLADEQFGSARVSPPRHEDWGATVTYVWDPCGVLLHLTEWDE